ncbi:DUF4440 domain-containing protein [Altererythrobacter luteolus]|uniref:DUF4440 domain-containing protein n=1 Tax=Pontixanthobacter luteolus TaxID=295089 RepID=A0A6I4V465_9SPHN|nr:DUF4440 domain-containing protein [Pontixanthobacter luteolus]MXP47620.1 DUF4440 domain-containing protein [Pontixanthobacter luteolus]
MLSILAAATLQASSPSASASAHAFPEETEMHERIRKADAQLFWAFFEGCDPALQAEVIHPDFRMVHDLEGLAIPNRDFMLEQASERCEARKPGGSSEGYSNRRLLVPGSRIIRRMGQWGALEQGQHTFHEWRADKDGDSGEWEMTGGARYMHVWQWMPEERRFRLLESLSYDHGATQPYPPDLD